MKIIHCADVHLDSRMTAHFDIETAKKRRIEILETFRSMIEYAASNSVEAILIAGDLFDTNSISALAGNSFLSAVRQHGGIQFYYLRGNHDLSGTGTEELPENLHMFGDEWTFYHPAAGITLAGAELTPGSCPSLCEKLSLNENEFNIVMLHGQTSAGAAGERAEMINLRAFRNRGIDYLALGHVHTYRKEVLDSRAVFCYPGCLEGRGFDECGTHGFVLLDVDPASGKFTHSFIPFAKRKLYEVSIDISDCMREDEIEKRILDEICSGKYPDCGENLFRFCLTGEVEADCEKDPVYLESRVERYVFYAQVRDKTELKINYGDYLQEESLKGEFVRSVIADASLSGKDKKYIIRNGLRLIDGREIDGI